MPSTTPLHEQHLERGARMVDFAGWEMPLHYGSQIEEHHAVRRDAGLFDVSHMGVIDLEGVSARECLQHLLASDVGRLESPGDAVYGCMLREDAGILDDLVAFFVGGIRFRLVVNAGRRSRDLAWIRERAEPYEVEIRERDDLAVIAVQGPNAREKAASVFDSEDGERLLVLEAFRAVDCDGLYVARTGYTGEDGWEMLVPADRAAALWQALVARGIRPAGLGARDTLRLEAGMNLYGVDMDETTHPLESRLGWTIAWGQAFIGRVALERIRTAGSASKLVGLVLEDRGVLRSGQAVRVPGEPDCTGSVTSGTFSPTLERSIGFARVPAGTGGRVEVEVRGRQLRALVVKPPFARRGRILV